MTAAAFEHAELLRRLARQDVEPIASNTGLATELNRDPSNLRKTFKALADDGVLQWTPGEVPTVTDRGRQTLRGIDVAQGLASPDATNPRWPLDRIRPNPANRSIDPEGIEDMALSIVAVTPPDVYTPVTLTPVLDDGFRMLLAGERRWRGALKATAEHDLSAAPIAEGLLFVEREATEAEALQLMIIENTQREGLSPLEDARQLFRLQQLTGLNGVDLAIHVGRCDRQNKNGAKDVQEKLKIIREATPEAIADYEARGSWDDLRNSVRTKRETADAPAGAPTDVSTFTLANERPGWKGGPLLEIEIGHIADQGWIAATRGNLPNGGWAQPFTDCTANATRFETRSAALDHAKSEIRRQFSRHAARQGEALRFELWLAGIEPEARDQAAPTGPHVVNGVDYYNASRAHQARVDAGLAPRPAANHGGGSAAAGTQPARELSGRTRLALIELAHKIYVQRQPLDPTADSAWSGDAESDYAAFGAFVGTYWLETSFSDLQSERLVRAVHLAGGVPPMAALTPKGFEWFVGQAIPLPPSMRTLRTAQEASGHAGEPDTYATSWIAKEVAPAASAGWVNGTPYERKFDRHNPDRTASSYSPDLPWDEWLERPAAEFIDIDRKETFALGPIAHDFPTAQIEVAPLVGGAGWVYGAGYSAAGMGHHERLDRVHNTQEAFDDRETAIAAGVDLIRDSLGSAVRNKLPARIYDWTVAMLSPTTRPVAGSLIDHDDEQPDLIPLTADDLAEMERRRALDAEREIDERAVDWFSGLMKDKLAAAREKGRAGWHDDNACLIDDLAESLIDHIEQGDPTDIANFAMFVLKRAGQDGAREAISQAFEATVKAA